MPSGSWARAVVYTALIVCLGVAHIAVAEIVQDVELGDFKRVRRLASNRAITEKPEIIITEEVDTAASSPLPSPLAPGGDPSPPPADDTGSNASSIAQKIDEALAKEFGEDTKQIASEAGKTFNETVQREEAVLETVVRISSKNKGKDDDDDDNGHSNNSSNASGDTANSQDSTALPHFEQEVDRIIDSHDNVFVLSASKDGAAALTLDPQLIQDLTFILATAALMGMLFEGAKQPVINGYLVAGAILGPGGLGYIKELVQVESLAQLGVQLLLFGLGRELSLSKLKAVWGVALLGGFLQILALMLLGGMCTAMLMGRVALGVFIGALLSMSSTSVVVKCLEVTKATGTVYGQITIGTLILQDCTVGLMFALMPAFAPAAVVDASHTSAAAAAAAAAADGATAASSAADAAVAAALASSSGSDAAVLAVLLLIVRVLLKLAVVLAISVILAKTLLPVLLRLLLRHCSKELVQLALVSGCLGCAWLSGKLQLSEELGAFIAGAIVSLAERTLISRGYLPPASPSSSPRAGSGSSGSLNGLMNSFSQLSTSSGGGSSTGGTSNHHSHPGEGPPHAGIFANIDSIINVMTALFVASIGLIMSPVFLWHHLWVLLAGTVVVAMVKVVVVGAVVHMFGTPIATSAAVGLTMAHIGEFSFVLLSMANQLKLLSPQLYMLLLGVTAMSLLTTPPVIMLSSRLLQQDSNSSGGTCTWRRKVASRGPGVGANGTAEGHHSYVVVRSSRDLRRGN